MRKERVYVALFILIISGLFAYAYRGFLGARMLSYGDSSPFPETANQAFSAFTSAWQPLSGGIVYPWTLITFIEGLTLVFCGGNSVLAQKIFYLAPLPLAFLAMYFFLGKLKLSRSAKVIASFAYSVNPVNIGNFIGGAHTGFYALVFAPLVSVVLINISDKKNLLRNTIFLSLLVALSISSNLMVAVFCFFPFAIYAMANPLFKKKIKSFVIVLATLSASLIFAFLLTFPYSFFAYFMANQYLPGNLPTQEVLAGLVGNIRYNYASSSMINIMKFGSTSLSFLGYLDSAPLALLGLLYPLLAYGSLLFRSDKRNSKIKITLALYSFIPITLIWLAYLGPGLQIYLRFPMLFAFSNPSGLNTVLAFTYAPLIAFTIDKVWVFFRRLIAQAKSLQQRSIDATGSFHKLAFVNALLLFIIITGSFAAYNWPFFTGDMAFSSAGRPIDQSTVPSVIYQAATWLNEHRTSGEDFRTLWVPLDYQTQLDIRWLDPGAVTIPLGTSQYVNLSITRYVGFVFYALANSETSRIGALLAPLNVKYIVVNLNSSQTGSPSATGFLEYGEPFLYGSPLGYVRILNSQKDLELVANQTGFLIYENLEYLPSVTVYSNSFYVMPITNETDESLIDLKLTEALSTLPGFEPRYQTLIFGGELDPGTRTFFLENSAAVVITASDVDQLSEDYSLIKGSQAIIGFFSTNFTQRSVFADNFSDLSKWTVVSGNWTVQDNQVFQNDPTIFRARITAGDPSWSNYIMEGKVMFPENITDTGKSAAFIVRYVNDTSYYEVWLNYNHMSLRKVVNGVSEWIADSPYNINVMPNTWYDVKVAVNGASFNVYLNGELMLSISDQAYSRGAIGLTTYQANVAFSNLSVYELLPTASILVPRSGFYRLMTSVSGNGTISYSINGGQVNATQIGDGWWESDLVYLATGTYDATINYNGSLDFSDYLVACQTPNNLTLTEFLNNSSNVPINYTFQEISGTDYSFKADLRGPTFIYLGEMYDQGWNAYVNGEKLEHFNTDYFGNGFYINKTGEINIIIKNDLQDIKNITLYISATSWLAAFIGLVYVSRRRIKDLIPRSLSALKIKKGTRANEQFH